MSNLSLTLALKSAILAAKKLLFDAPLTSSLALATGSGATTFTRATTATVWGHEESAVSGATQKLLTVPANIPRFVGARYIASTEQWSEVLADDTPIPDAELLGQLIERVTTNLFTYSEDISQWTILANYTNSTFNVVTAPDGTTTADLIVPNAGVTTQCAGRTCAVTLGVTYTLSCFAKNKDLGSFKLRASGNSNYTATFDLVNGTILNKIGVITANIELQPDGVWYLCSITFVEPTGGNRIMEVGVNTAYATPDGAKGFYIWGMQLEAGSWPTSYSKTEAATVTRNATVVYEQTTGNINAAKGTLYFEFTPAHNAAGTIYYFRSFVDASNYTDIYSAGTNLYFRKVIAGTSYAASIAFDYAQSNTYLIAVAWGGSGLKVAVNGSLGTAHANTAALQLAATMYLGSNNSGSSQIDGAFQHVKTWNYQMSDSELESLTYVSIPSPLPTGALFAYDASTDTLSKVYANNEYLPNAAGATGYDFKVEQGSASAFTVVTESSLQALRVYQNAGSAQIRAVTAIEPVTTPLTFIVVANVAVGGTYLAGLSEYPKGALYRNNSSNQVQIFTYSGGTATAAQANQAGLEIYLVELPANDETEPKTFKIDRNGINIITTTNSTDFVADAYSPFALWAGGGTTSFYLREFRIWNRRLTADEKTNYINSLKTKWGI